MTDESQNPAEGIEQGMSNDLTRDQTVDITVQWGPANDGNAITIVLIDWRKALFNILDAFICNEGVVFEDSWTEFGVSETDRAAILSQWEAWRAEERAKK